MCLRALEGLCRAMVSEAGSSEAVASVVVVVASAPLRLSIAGETGLAGFAGVSVAGLAFTCASSVTSFDNGPGLEVEVEGSSGRELLRLRVCELVGGVADRALGSV